MTDVEADERGDWALPATLTEGMTVWGAWGGAQIRLEQRLADGELEQILTGAGDDTPVIPIIEAVLMLAVRDDCPRSTEDGNPYRLTADEARALRDLLNIATARGAL